jgi:hypothetical protein
MSEVELDLDAIYHFTIKLARNVCPPLASTFAFTTTKTNAVGGGYDQSWSEEALRD